MEHAAGGPEDLGGAQAAALGLVNKRIHKLGSEHGRCSQRRLAGWFFSLCPSAASSELNGPPLAGADLVDLIWLFVYLTPAEQATVAYVSPRTNRFPCGSRSTGSRMPP